jgi:hypothetical protein
MPRCPQCGFELDHDETACGQCGRRLESDSVYRADYTREELLAIGLTPTLVDFVFTDPKPRPFINWCEPRESGWPCVVPEDAAAVYPLWTCNANVTAACMFGDRLRFVQLNHDDPEPEPLADTEQGLLARLFVPLIESPRATPKGLRDAAALVGFLSLDELTRWHKRNGASGNFQEKLDRWVESLDRKRS